MNVLKTICMAFSTYSRIPMPQMKWEEKNAEYVICFYPLVGAVIGAAEAALLWLADRKGFPSVVTALLLIVIPILLSGGIHVDGLIDTADARHSYLPKEEKQRILKDPHIGAFGVIRLLLYLMAMLAGLILLTEQYTVRGEQLIVYALAIPFWSRIMCAYTAIWFPKARKDGMLKAVTGGKTMVQTIVLSVFALLCIAVLAGMLPLAGEAWRILLWFLADLLMLLWYRRMAIKEFGGVSGDLAGWLLCMLELIGVIVLIPATIFG